MIFIRKIKKGNKVYLAEVEGKRVNGKVVQKHIRYIGRQVNNEAVISMSSEDLEIEDVKIHGPLFALHEIATEINLPEILGDYSDEILSMVYAHCLDYESVNNMPEWYERTDLNTILDLEGLTEHNLLSALDSLVSHGDEYQKEIFLKAKKKYKLNSRGIVYDVTNTYLYGKKCPMGKKGKSKDGKRNRPLIQIGLATTQKEGVPVFHKTFDGNVHDSKTLNDLVDNFARYKIPSGLFVYDRGITSAKNINYIGELGWDTLCGVSLKEKEKNTIRRVLKNKPIVDVSNRCSINKNTIYVKCVNYNYSGIKGKLAICFNRKKQLEIQESRLDEITNAQKLLSSNKSIKQGLGKYFTRTGRLRVSELKKVEEFDGYSCIFSTKKKVSDKDMVQLYFDKDVVEKSFRTLKGITNLQPVRHWLYNRVKSHVFICYLSCMLLSILKLKLKKIEISPVQALKDLDTIYKVCVYDKKKKNRFYRTKTISKHQEDILKAIKKKA